MKKLLFCVPLLAATVTLAQQSVRHEGGGNRPIPRGASIYIEQMEHDLDGYLKAEFIKKKIPLRIVGSADQANYILTGSSTDEQRRKWHQGWLTAEQDRTSANIVLVDKQDNLVWAGEAGDRSLWWGSAARGGHRKVASRLANRIKKAVTKR